MNDLHLFLNNMKPFSANKGINLKTLHKNGKVESNNTEAGTGTSF